MVTETSNPKIAAIVPVYYPDNEITKNISSYIGHVDMVYIFLNSTLNKKLSEDLKSEHANKIYFLGSGTNVGIADAYNICAEHARERNFSHILTMDQDSSFITFPTLEKLKNCSLLYPSCQLNDTQLTQKAPWIMNSGCLVSLSTWEELGGYDTDLFVDAVDFEFMMRTLHANKTVLEGDGLLRHNLGNSLKHIKILGFKIRVTNHKSYRVRWFCRNYVYISRLWFKKKPTWAFFLFYIVLVRLIKIALFEKDKSSKIAAGIKGLQEGFCSVLVTTKQPTK